LITQDEADWLIHDTSFKPWPACRHTHATIDCVMALREADAGHLADFRHCEVEGFRDALAICDNPRPATRTEAKFSLQYVVVATAEFGVLRPEHFDAACFERDDLRSRMARVSLRVAPDITQRYPAHYGARVTMTLADGKLVNHEVQDSLGDPERALPEAAILEKARKLMAYAGVTEARAQQALDAAADLLGSDRAAFDALFPPGLLAPLL
jgi:2-methylcitrate dehydratase PrpD